jgi:flagellin-like protein
MKTLRKIRKSTKALSPVVASIILIAVTVAVSIAVAAWMGALTIGFMGTEEVKITNVQFADDLSTATLTIKNTGSAAVTISEAYQGSNGGEITPITLDPGATDNTVVVAGPYTAGTSYQFKVVSQKGNPFVYTMTAPSV